MEMTEYLKELAKKQLEYANLPVMQKRAEAWYKHNRIQGEKPMIIMEESSFLDEIVESKCEDELDRQIERQLLQNIKSYELINDDKVIPNYFTVPINFEYDLFTVKQERTYAKDSIGFHDEPILVELDRDIGKLSHTQFYYNKEKTQRTIDRVNDTIGDILPIQIKNAENHWHFGITQQVVNLMGMENMFIAMYDYPDEFHNLMQFIVDDFKLFLRFQEENKLIFANNENDYMGGGSYCFNNELNFDGTSKTTWGHMNSQETVGINPQMYKEFIYPYYKQIALEFGLIYYGCCEPVSEMWDVCLKDLPNMRKVSISAWCNEEMMAERLSNSNIIYSRKPSPNFIGITKEFDECEFKKHINKTVKLTKNCKTEFIFRDIYKLNGNVNKIKRAVELVRECYN